jgi:uncharacterized protein YdiU (UPF0061 family)
MDGLDLAALFAGNSVPPGADAMALAYAGHQFGHFVPQLGDGRAVLLGDVRDAQGVRRDIQLKGAGRTKFSRGGDGRAALGPVLREYLVSEAMHALGVPTTRALCAVTTGEHVFRERALPGAVVTRVLASNIRVGTFQYLAVRGDEDGIRILADYVIDRHYPELREAENPYLALLEAVVERQAALVAKWLHVGFIHGVMNTDNMAVSGETIDFGPCAFMDAYDPATVFSSIDELGRYAYANQPRIAQWNLTRLAETLLPLVDKDEARSIELATGVIRGFGPKFDLLWLDGMRRKIGLRSAEEGDRALIQSLLDLMQANLADYTLVFRRLDEDARELFVNPLDFDGWAEKWRARLAREGGEPAAMDCVNPLYIPRNYLVEEALEAAVERADFVPFHELCEVLRNPFTEQQGRARYADLPPPSEAIYRTFCGT